METSSEEYIILNEELHSRPEGYGGRGYKWLSSLMYFAGKVGGQTILDYGAGQRSLAKTWHKDYKGRDQYIQAIYEYDPAVKGIKKGRREVCLVNCTDVLEHVEPDLLENVFQDLATLGKKGCFMVIATRLSNKVLKNGKNSHLIIETPSWWYEKAKKYWSTVTMIPINTGEFILEGIHDTRK